MTGDQIRARVLEALGDVAPEFNLSHLRPERPLRAQMDIDSYDFLRLIVALHDKLDVDIPEADYDRLSTLESSVAYLAGRLDRGSEEGTG